MRAGRFEMKEPADAPILGQVPRRLSENRKSTAEKWALARLSHYYRQIERLFSSNNENI